MRWQEPRNEGDVPAGRYRVTVVFRAAARSEVAERTSTSSSPAVKRAATTAECRRSAALVAGRCDFRAMERRGAHLGVHVLVEKGERVLPATAGIRSEDERVEGVDFTWVVALDGDRTV